MGREEVEESICVESITEISNLVVDLVSVNVGMVSVGGLARVLTISFSVNFFYSTDV